LENCYKLIRAKNYRVINVDSTVCLETPKIKKHAGEMREVIAAILQITKEDVSVKATTTEKMGFAGREEGLVAYATVLLCRV
jgi:2-C-methyl-D-erythritol 2,4-cyclodiphosphate synthase